LGTFLLSIYYFIPDDSQRITARRLDVNHGLISNIFKRLQDVCSRDLADRPIIPFGSPGSDVKCDEGKFNHKAKYGRGRRAARDVWVFGIVSCDYNAARGYFQVVDR
ncbi:unnamed protein product, partial [Porites evermanni]